MSNAFSLVRTLVIYSVCVPLAVTLGYLLAAPDDYMNLRIVGLVLGCLTIPLLLKWHHFVLVLSWNLIALAFFLPGYPMVFLPACASSFMVSILQYVLNRRLRFLSAPMISWPLLTLLAVVIVTAELRGGINLHSFGESASFGGRRYIFIIMAVVGYYALTAQRIPFARAGLYAKMYFLGPMTSCIGYLASFVSPGLYFLFLVFPADMTFSGSYGSAGQQFETSRLSGLSIAATAVWNCLLALYGIRGLVDLRRLWRPALFLVCSVIALMGGFRSALIFFVMVFALQFYLEGLFRSRLLPVFILGGILTVTLVLPFTDKLPLSIQRTLSFLPVKVDLVAESDAQGSTEWRVRMWERVLPEVPRYLLLGKGYAIDAAEFAATTDTTMNRGADPFEGSMLAGDYHNGPLSLLMPFGIWGALAFIWLLIAGVRALYQNYAFGEPRLQAINTFLLTTFACKAVFFFLVFGSLYSDLAVFTGLLGLSVSLNGGVRQAYPVPAAAKPVVQKLKLAGVTR